MPGARAASHPAVYNAANEVAVEAFWARTIGWLEIVDTVAAVLGRGDVPSPGGPLTVDDVLAADAWARTQAEARIEGFRG